MGDALEDEPQETVRSPGRRLLPPRALLLALVVQIAAYLALPSAVLALPWLVRALGTVVIACGIAIAAAGAGRFKRAGTAIIPFEPATELVISGPYRVTRNPMYLGLTTVLVGAALVLASAPALLVALAYGLWLHWAFVREEEVFMARRFGDAYEAYRARVRRWL